MVEGTQDALYLRGSVEIRQTRHPKVRGKTQSLSLSECCTRISLAGDHAECHLALASTAAPNPHLSVPTPQLSLYWCPPFVLQAQGSACSLLVAVSMSRLASIISLDVTLFGKFSTPFYSASMTFLRRKAGLALKHLLPLLHKMRCFRLRIFLSLSSLLLRLLFFAPLVRYPFADSQFASGLLLCSLHLSFFNLERSTNGRTRRSKCQALPRIVPSPRTPCSRAGLEALKSPSHFL